MTSEMSREEFTEKAGIEFIEPNRDVPRMLYFRDRAEGWGAAGIGSDGWIIGFASNDLQIGSNTAKGYIIGVWWREGFPSGSNVEYDPRIKVFTGEITQKQYEEVCERATSEGVGNSGEAIAAVISDHFR